LDFLEVCVSSKGASRLDPATERECEENTPLGACLVDGDAAQRTRNRQLRQRSLIFSVFAQFAILAALVLVPIFANTERIALANVMPMPPYRQAARREPAARHLRPTAPRSHAFSFCLQCAPVAPHEAAPMADGVIRDELSAVGSESDAENDPCPACTGLLGNGHAPPAEPRGETPKIVHTQLDPAMLIRRVEPLFPVLARQSGREGTVELRAIIATDGSVRSLEFVHGDMVFYQSAVYAVRQWRYKPTILKGQAVEVDTHIVVTYRLNR
jgi:TonB family protein